jgi:hypothetical protein
MAVSSFPYGVVAAARGPRLSLTGATLSDTAVNPTDSSVGYQIATGQPRYEQSYEGDGQPYGNIDQWLLGGDPSNYEVRCTVNSGTTPDGDSTGSWLDLGVSARAWTLTDTSTVGSPITNNLTIEIRDKATSTVQASATVTMSVHKTA